MRYNEERKIISLSVGELVSIARKRVSSVVVRDEDLPHRLTPDSALSRLRRAGASPYNFTHGFSVSGWDFELVPDTDAVFISDGHIYVAQQLEGERTSPDRELERRCRAEAFICGYVHAKERGLKSVLLTIIYTNRLLSSKNEIEERVSLEKLISFFERCRVAVGIYAAPEVERVTKRLPSLKNMRFPYPEIREGQRAFIEAAYRTVSRGKSLVAGAPTGTGKTVSALYPALRAYGALRCDKIFYFTPKTTTAAAARDCIIRMCECGAVIRAVIISSKESTCEAGLICRSGRGLCKNRGYSKLSDAALELYAEQLPVLTVDAARAVARRFSVCPYELMLTYSELCDVIICDFNYLFDPDVYIRRYFSEGGNYAFLFDEAHNLPSRAQQIFSAEISETDISAPLTCELIGELSPLRECSALAKESFRCVLYTYLADEIRTDADGGRCAGVHTSSLPSALYEIFERLEAAAERELYASYLLEDENAPKRSSFLHSYLRNIKKFNRTLKSYDDSYETFIFLENEHIRAKLFCIDTGRAISERLSLGGSSVFFSATLTPLYYYRAIFGLGKEAELLEVDSPFTTGQLSVSVMDKVSTRLSEREDTLGAVCRIIAATVSAKRGHYMIFSPSFAYSEALADAFARKYPKIQILRQKRNMTRTEREEFIKKFEHSGDSSYLIGFCVMGGIYSEGIDLAGDSLIGAVVVGIGIPALTFEREAMRAYYDDKYEEGMQFAYIYPGINRVLQAGGRVIRREDDYGALVLIDDRFDDPIYKKTMPSLWRDMKFIPDAKRLREELDSFWCDVARD